MKRVLVLTEGQTESDFIKIVLRPHLEAHHVWPIPTTIVTKRVLHGPDHKGGDVRYSRLVSEARRLLLDSNAAAVTTLVDYYGFRFDRPGDVPNDADALLKIIKTEIDHPRFLPYLQVHEFEALLFSDPAKVATELGASSKAQDMLEILSDFAGPEKINNDPATSPSARIERLFPMYPRQKRILGVRAARAVGLTRMSEACPRFAKWLASLEQLGDATSSR